MRHNKLLTILALTLLLVVSSCGDNGEQKAAAPEGPAPSFPVVTMQTKTVTGYQEYPANIEGIVNSDVRAKVSGYIQKVLVDEGQKVRKGQVLFKLETQSLSQDAGAAKARINVAQVEVNKLIPLVEKNIISPVQLETAKANLAQAQANYSSVSASVGYATIKSPVDGYVGSINFREGALISPGDSKPLTTVSEISQVYAFFSFNEAQYIDLLQRSEGTTKAERIKNSPDLSLVLANGKIYSETGRIQTSTGQINENTGTIKIRAAFDNPNEILTNGNSGKIRFPIEYKDALVLPQSSTFEQQKDIVAFIIDKDNKAKSTILKIQGTVGNLYVVESGLKAGDKLIVSGVGKIRDGMAITPQDTPFDEAIKPIEVLFKN
ncbi:MULTISPECIES: efflux RND transporter periplasmic adaptor subunit [Cellulophaga]|jgi:membrane fusion protein (multidrug efflux system)|uniref:Secretion protein HlyD n=1 Tax=Cellulophaga baltica 18 TaxID=1348584 RepID=A0AAU8RA09_9FLAO|nr:MULTISPECIES: efflux RND transporter periplasmic adaptor subunit [Cellulophaga]AIZ40809.1 secretion protein HlyD [Cellulophaga baltica 18]KGK31158.1 secretion protein HlyD [Cellulophaga sp. E6(2014)]MCR1025609.1 efflux RND transporter periplasmic adaptor subunit [Cellulophaga baltica]WFO15214.1 efflux RND transporter periplasmic adaptor subunit [Cellulophaga baltica 4]